LILLIFLSSPDAKGISPAKPRARAGGGLPPICFKSGGSEA